MAAQPVAPATQFPRIYQPTLWARWVSPDWKQLFAPHQLILDDNHILTRWRGFPFWWIIREESIPYSKIGAVQLKKGMFWTTVEIENTGGVDPILFKGLANNQAIEVRDIIERKTSG